MAKTRGTVQHKSIDQSPEQDVQLEEVGPVQAVAEARQGPVSADSARALNSAVGNAAVQQLVSGGDDEGGASVASGGADAAGDAASDGAVQALGGFAVQRKGGEDTAQVHQAAGRGIAGAGGAVPHGEAIQSAFGHHDISGVRAHTDTRAAEASADMGAAAYATGDDIAFGSASPDLHTAAHEAAHVVQQSAGVQLSGGVGAVGDRYEVHADAVADKVVAGQSAEALLDTVAPPSETGGAAGVQRSIQRAPVQLDIAADLDSAMDGWGTDEDAIYSRLRRASQDELQAVLSDASLMSKLRSELSQSELSYVLDLLQAPLSMKLKLAMDGWGTDEGYIHRSLTTATPDQLLSVANDAALVNELGSELSGDSFMEVFDQLPLPIERKLRLAMDGWGTDEGYIIHCLQGATPEELARIADDAALVDQLRSELSGDDFMAVFDRLPLSIERRLGLAMDGWGTEEGYIHRCLQGATPEELARVADNAALVDRLQSELSGDDIRSVLDRLPLPLSRKLKYAVDGWGTDEAYIFRAVRDAPLGEVMAVVADAALVALVDADLSGFELNAWRGILAKRLWLEGNDRARAFAMIDDESDSNRSTRLLWLGDLSVQRNLLDQVILNDTDATRIIHAFQSYWIVEIGVRDGATMSQWPVAVLQNIHAQLKVLPDQDTRAGFWHDMTLSDKSLIDPTSGQDVGLRNRAAWGGGNFIVGTQANSTGTTSYGYGTKLTAAAAAGANRVTVEEGDRLQQNDTIKVGSEGGLKLTNISGATWTLDKTLTSAHGVNTQVTPDDGSALRSVNWLAATVRHEIAHGVDENLGATVKGFTVGLGGWWTGDFDGWSSAMPDPWHTDAATALTEAEKGKIKTAIEDSVSGQKGSLYSQGLAADHPVVKYQADNIPVILAAEACLSRGDSFFNSPTQLYRAGGKGFSVSFWYKKFMYFNEDIIAQRVKNYGLYAPTEFFAEAYTVFYEEAGRPGVADADYGRLLRNTTWRSWIRSNIHERGSAPAGTGASGSAPGAAPGGSSKGRHGGDPGP